MTNQANTLGPLLGALEAEQGLIGAVLINNEALRRVEGLVSEEDFTEPLHQMLWRVMVDAERANKRIDPKLLVTMIGPDAQVPVGNEAGKPFTVRQYIARLAAEATTIINAPDYANAIRDVADQNRMASIGAALRHEVPVKVEAVVADAIDKLDHLLSTRTNSATAGVTMEQAVCSAMDAAAMAYQLDGQPSGLAYGLADLDHMTLGMQPSELIILAGRPGMGKTALGLGIARNVAETGKRTLFFSLEMNDVGLAQRVLADHLYDQHPMPYWLFRSGKFSEKDFEFLRDAALHVGKLPIKIEQQPGMTIAQIAGRARQYKRRHGLDLIVVDHMHLVRPSDRYSGHRVEEIGETTRGLKGLAKELDIPVLALCQLSRGVESREDKRPGMSDLRGSGDIEQDADAIIMLYREAYYLLRNKPQESNRDAFAQWIGDIDKSVNRLEAIIEKQRNGPTGTIELFCSIEHNAIRTLAPKDHLPDRIDPAPAKPTPPAEKQEALL